MFIDKYQARSGANILMERKMKFVVSAAIASLVVAIPAQAADYSWQVRSETTDGKVMSIVAESESETGVLLSCATGKLVAGVSVQPGPITERLNQSTKRTKRKKATMEIGDKEPNRDVWTYLPTTKIAISRRGTTGRKFFNAAVRGDTVTLTLDGKEGSTFTFPGQNDAFKSFANSCSVTNGS